MHTRILSLLLVSCVALSSACATSIPNRDPVGETFPSVNGKSLAGEPTRLPEDLKGKPAVLLVAYDQDTQFDVDRWLLGLLQAKLDAQIYEVPTVGGLVPTLISEGIDEGMRSGIPPEDWKSVVTVYDEADPITAFTGTEGRRNCRVLLLDAAGKVVWFHDEGYSARELLEMKAVLDGLSPSEPTVGAK